jgi:hypothetical protein
MKNRNAQRTSLTERLVDGSRYASGKTVEAVGLSNFLQAVIPPGDRVCLEGDNQKQADVLVAALANIDPARIHDLHTVQSDVVLSEHLDVFEKRIARKLDYSYSGPPRWNDPARINDVRDLSCRSASGRVNQQPTKAPLWSGVSVLEEAITMPNGTPRP